MLWMVFVELFPEAFVDPGAPLAAAAFAVSVAAMLVFQALLHG